MTTSLPPGAQVPEPMVLPLFDAGHPYIMDVPAALATELVDGPNGQRLGLTIRIPNTTVTVMLAKDDAQRWVDQIRGDIARMSGLIIPT